MANDLRLLHIAPPNSNAYCTIETLKDCEGKPPYQLLQDELPRFTKADIIIIDLDYMRTGDFKSGIELLKLIRLHHIRTHCIVYSIRPELYHVSADANKSILLSEGVTYVEMLNYIDDEHLHFATLAKQKSPEDLRDYFWHDYQQCFSDNRHFNANWWGPLRIMEYLKRADKNEDEDAIFQGNTEILGQKSSYNGLVLRYIKSLREQSVWDSVVENIMRESRLLEEENKQLDQVKANIAEALRSISTGSFINKEDIIKGAFSPIEKAVDENSERIETDRQEVAQYDQLKAAQHAENDSTRNIETLRHVLSARKPRILYLDDMAGYGWNVVLQRLIYKEDHSVLFDIWSSFSDVVDDYDPLAEKIIQEVNTKDYHLIILDLRLKNETGEIKPQDLSGIKLLEALRRKRIPCPILVITASRNPDTIDQVYASGADACWRKEGIDENNSTKPEERVAYTWSKIEQLLTIINTLCREEFDYLYKTMVREYYHKIKETKTTYWWEVIGENNVTGMESIDKAEFLKHLDTAILAYQKVLVDQLKGRKVSQEFLGPCEACFNILEVIHPKRKNSIPQANGSPKKISGFGDMIKYDFDQKPRRRGNNSDAGAFINNIFDSLKIRNAIIHPTKPTDEDYVEVNRETFAKCINILMDYLMQTLDAVKPFLRKETPNIGDLSTVSNQNQKVSFKRTPIRKFFLDEVTRTPSEVSTSSHYDYAYIKAIQRNKENGSLQYQLCDTAFAPRVIGNCVHAPKTIDWRQGICFTPTKFNQDNRIDIDFYYDDTTAWQGKISDHVDIQTNKPFRKVDDLQCLKDDTWFVVSYNANFDVTQLHVGDSIQFRLKGSCELPGELGGN